MYMHNICTRYEYIFEYIYIFLSIHIYMNASLSFLFYYLLSGVLSLTTAAAFVQLTFSPCTPACVIQSHCLQPLRFPVSTAVLNTVTSLVRNSWDILDEPLIHLLYPEGRIQRSFWPPSTSSARLPAICPPRHPPLHLWALCTVARQSHRSSPLHLSVYAGKYCFHGVFIGVRPSNS